MGIPQVAYVGYLIIGGILMYAGIFSLIFYDTRDWIGDRWFARLRFNMIGNRWRITVGLIFITLAGLIISHGMILIVR
jgi:hypothetical protein